VKSLITARWKREELWLARCCGWSQQRASGAASTAGELISGSPCRSDGLADGRGNSEQDLCVLAVAGTGLTRMLGPSCRTMALLVDLVGWPVAAGNQEQEPVRACESMSGTDVQEL
jgi:hypothetical protein